MNCRINHRTQGALALASMLLAVNALVAIATRRHIDLVFVVRHLPFAMERR